MPSHDAVWAATYGAAFHSLLGDELSLSPWPDKDRLLAICEDAQTVADAAVEALMEHETLNPPEDGELSTRDASISIGTECTDPDPPQRCDAHCSTSNLCDSCECEHSIMKNNHVYCYDRGEYHPPVRRCHCYQPIEGLVPATKSEQAPPRQRDESRDLWVYDGDLGATDYVRHSDLNERNKWITNGERYVQYSDLVSEQLQNAVARDRLSALSSKLGAGLGDESRSLSEYVRRIDAEIDHHLSVANNRIEANAQDAVLLDAILEAYDPENLDSNTVDELDKAITERGKR